jgi:hypothetical protein
MPKKSQNKTTRKKNTQVKKDIIIHLPINPTDFENIDTEKSLLLYNPSCLKDPAPYSDPNNDLYEMNDIQNEVHNTFSIVDMEKEVMEKIKNNENYNVKLMNDYGNLNIEKRRPKDTNLACWWDCHSFEGTPIGIPNDYKNGTYYIYGNFCSPECAASYLFSEQLSNNEKYIRYEMLQEYYHKMIHGNSKINRTERIELAPNKLILKKFGGLINIETYRNLIKNYSKKANILQPPLVSIIPSLEVESRDTIFSNHNQIHSLNNTEKGVSKARNMILKRNKKPARVRGTTLKDTMMLKFQKK